MNRMEGPRATSPTARSQDDRVSRRTSTSKGQSDYDRAALEREADRAADGVFGALLWDGQSVPSKRPDSPVLGIDFVRGGEHGLAGPARAFYESRFGFDFSGVRIYAGDGAGRPVPPGGTWAMTRGSDISLHPNIPAAVAPRVLTHELTHVIQQGAVLPLGGSWLRPVSPAACAPDVQYDLAVEPPNPTAAVVPLTADQVRAAIRFNQARFDDPYVFAVIRDVVGVSRFPAVVDEDLVQAIARWQAARNLAPTGRIDGPTTATIVAEIRAEATLVPALLLDAVRVELEAALVFNSQLNLDALTIRIIQRVVGAPVTGTWTDATIQRIMARQRTEHLNPDGMVGPATLRVLITALTTAGLFDDAIHVIVNAHHFPITNLALIQFDATVTGADAVTTGTIGTGQPQTVRVGPSTFTATYEHMIRIIGHELQHVQQRSGPVPITNQHVREFLAFSWEALSTDSPAMTPADRVNHANIAISHWNLVPIVERTPHQGVRDRLDQLIAAGGVGNF